MLIAVYGSLKKGQYNFDRFIQSGFNLEFVKEEVINGFDLYDLGYYPGVKVTSSNNPLTIHILQVDQECFKVLDRMEKGAGYSQKVVATSAGDAILWVYEGDISMCRKIPSGNY
jgi:gamma-glutamylcyclotransferase (GGCT)/AIG2-like uncharacterized protein YtfP